MTLNFSMVRTPLLSLMILLLEVTARRNIKLLGLWRILEFHSFSQKTVLESLEKKISLL